MFGVAVEGGIVVTDGAGGDKLFTDSGDYFIELLD